MQKLILSLTLILWFVAPLPVLAQDAPELTLQLSRDFGYSSGSGQIQGTFSLKASGPENLARVTFLIDDQVMGEDAEAPFRLQFNTDGYPLGIHTLSAVGYTSDGREIRSSEQRREFVAASEGLQTAGKIILPILAIIIGIMLLSFLLPSVFGRGKTGSLPLGAPRSYGMLGGTICPKCQRPFGMHIFGMNMLIGKLDRCPHCGRWSLVRHVPMELLKAAEAAELQMVGETEEVPEVSEEEKLRRDLEKSRFQDL